ncbi:MAG: GNAT family N-acetyltransferase [Promethearchaeota archaeon]
MPEKRKNPKGKIEKYIGVSSLDSLNILSDDDDFGEFRDFNAGDEKEPSDKGKKTSTSTQKNKKATTKDNKGKRENKINRENGQFIGKLQEFFQNLGFKDSIRLNQIEKTSKSESPAETPKYVAKDYVYIQMKLNIENLPNVFLKELETYRLSGIHIRQASEKDLSTFVKLYNRSFMRGSDPWSPATEEQFKDILHHNETVVLIASTHGEDVGFIIIDLEEGEKTIGVVCGLGTDPRWQRKGIGRYLGIAAWEHFQKLNVKELHCEVYENNAASYNLIKSLHFMEYGRKIYQF